MPPRVQDRSRARPKQSGGNAGSTWKPTFTKDEEEEQFDESKTCVICAERIEISSLTPCSHTTCHKCTFRQRALYGKRLCLVCRTENEWIDFTDGKDVGGKFALEEKDYGIRFSSAAVYKKVMDMLAFKCQVCKEVKSSLKELTEHIKSVHEKFLCTICCANKKAFPYELKIFTYKQLQNHQIRGDEKGFDGHPLCGFCKGKRFYSEDELNLHLRDAHEKCHVCDQIDPSQPQYFRDYQSMEDHFRRDHFICNVQSCLDKKFVVFADDLDLQAHMVAEHGKAFQNGFKSQLSTFRTSAPASAASNSSAASSSNTRDATSPETKKLRFEERARHYLNYSNTKFKEFKDINNEFKNGHLTPQTLKQSYQELFKDTTEDDIYLLLYDFAQLFPPKSTPHNELLSFVKQHEQNASNEQNFPALPGSSAQAFQPTWGGAQNKTTKKQQKAALNEAFPALPSTSSASYTPVKTTVKYRTVLKSANQPVRTVRINTQRSNTLPNYLSAPSSAQPSRSVSPKINDEMFPELPKPVKPKPVIPRVNPIPQGNGVWGSGSPSSAGSSASNSTLNMSSMGDALPVVVKGKGKKKKQVLLL